MRQMVKSGTRSRDAVRRTDRIHCAGVRGTRNPVKIAEMNMPVPAAVSQLIEYSVPLSGASTGTTGGVRITTLCSCGTRQVTTADGTLFNLALTDGNPHRKTTTVSNAQ